MRQSVSGPANDSATLRRRNDFATRRKGGEGAFCESRGTLVGVDRVVRAGARRESASIRVVALYMHPVHMLRHRLTEEHL